MKTRYLIFLNIRSTVDEQHAILTAASCCGYEIIMLTKTVPSTMHNNIAMHVSTNGMSDDEIINQAKDLTKMYSIYGVFTWTDTDVILASQIAAAIDVPAPSIKSAYLARNKYEMRKAVQAEFSHLVPEFFEINTIYDIRNNLAKIKFPAIMKPISASGSKGIFIVNSLTEAEAAFNQLFQLMTNTQDGWMYNRYGNKIILESFIDGQEFSVEGLIVNKKLYIAGITDKVTTKEWFLERRHIFPANYDRKTEQEIIYATGLIIGTLDLDNCPIHLEGKWTNEGFKLIEIAARIGGDLIHTHLIPNSLQIDWLSIVINGITQQYVPNFNIIARKTNGIEFKVVEENINFNGFNINQNIYNIIGLTTIKELVKRNTNINLPPNDFASSRVGYVQVEGSNFNDVAVNLDSAINNLDI